MASNKDPREEGRPLLGNAFNPAPHMYDYRLSRMDNIRRYLATDTLLFSYANHILILTAWCVATNVGFVCMGQQKEVHGLTNFGLWLMAVYAAVLCIRLFVSVLLTTLAAFGGVVAQNNAPVGLLAFMVATCFSFMAFGLIFVVANSVTQSQQICWIMPDSMFEMRGIGEL